jgi:hypothetical protein
MNKKGMEFAIGTIAKLVLLLVGLAVAFYLLFGPNSIKTLLESWTGAFLEKSQIY